jgi:hypothetical protein
MRMSLETAADLPAGPITYVDDHWSEVSSTSIRARSLKLGDFFASLEFL